jgi:hypothetical protein
MDPPRQVVFHKFLYGAGRVGGLDETGGASYSQPCLVESIDSQASNTLPEVKEALLPQSSDSDCVFIDTKNTPVKVPFPE